MATTTTNLSLKKPALDDDALIADINNNMDTLDSTIGAPSSASAVDGANAFAKINSLNSNLTSKFKVTELGSFASESALATGLSTKIGTMTNGEVAFIQIQMSAATTNFGAYAYVGTLTRVAATYASFSVSVTTSGNVSHTVVGSMNNGTWKIEQLALNSRLPKSYYGSVSSAVSISAGSSYTFTLTMPNDLTELLAIIPISVGPSTWGSAVPAVVSSVNLANKQITIRAYATANYQPSYCLIYN